MFRWFYYSLMALFLALTACSGAPGKYARGTQYAAMAAADLDPSTPAGFDAAIKVDGYTLANLEVTFTRVAGTNVVMTCWTGETAAEAVAGKSILQSCTVTSGDCTSDDATWTKTISATDTWTWLVDTKGLAYLWCSAVSAASTTDTLAIDAALSVVP